MSGKGFRGRCRTIRQGKRALCGWPPDGHLWQTECTIKGLLSFPRQPRGAPCLAFGGAPHGAKALAAKVRGGSAGFGDFSWYPRFELVPPSWQSGNDLKTGITQRGAKVLICLIERSARHCRGDGRKQADAAKSTARGRDERSSGSSAEKVPAPVWLSRSRIRFLLLP